jgi:hypothetical protein
MAKVLVTSLLICRLLCSIGEASLELIDESLESGRDDGIATSDGIAPLDTEEISLLQRSVEFDERGRNQASSCKLRFMHIPKNMGGTISNFTAEKLGWDVNWKGEPMQLMRPEEYGIPGAGEFALQLCLEVHTPPSFWPSPNPYDLALSQGEEVFCITRNPYERALSIYKGVVLAEMSKLNDSAVLGAAATLAGYDPEKCTKQALNEKWQDWMSLYTEGHRGASVAGWDCFLYPQTMMIYGPGESKQWCQHILPIEDMPEAFNQLLDESDCDGKFIDNGQYDQHRSFDYCENLAVTDFTEETIAMFNAHYRKDFELLGYEMQ